MARIPTADERAREILSILVYDVRMTLSDAIPPGPLRVCWEKRGHRVKDLWAGLDRAIELGWIAGERLTTAGFEEAQPAQPTAAGVGGSVVNIHGNVGAVQTGSHATADVSMSVGDSSELVAALKVLREEIEKSTESTPKQRQERAEVVGDVINAVTAQSPNKLKITSLLSGLGTAVRTVASLRGAWALVHSAAVALGLMSS